MMVFMYQTITTHHLKRMVKGYIKKEALNIEMHNIFMIKG
ncbi:ORF319 [Staphylococcus phage Twort]|uniref:ORF319 n=1 Tax=Staphylococcus phage Twort (strain DSM 17442 / HER 48) TaxID=2908167 RepID=Q4Z9D8_BPTWO|nr:ORF319 [Staphylococcus phage Twort]AAX92482.1 ORF319 [Staphylococcus phage Twort]